MIAYTRSVALIVFVFLSAAAAAQHENDTWIFGNRAGIKFKNGLSSVITANNNPHALACISDKNTGDLLFSTNGKTVWDKNHNGMAGVNFQIPLAIAPEAIIVPFPNNSNKYYVFTSWSISVVDMSLNGNLGEVTSSKLIPYIGRALTVVKHAYNNSYWLITHMGNTTDEFRAYNISEQGVDLVPVITHAGPYCTAVQEPYITSSTDGKKLIAAYNTNNSTGIFYVFDFDKTCGKVLNHIILEKHPWWQIRWACFSPDNSKIYAGWMISSNTLYLGRNYIIQYSAPDYSQLDTVVEVKAERDYRDMALGPDNKIYITIIDSIPSGPSWIGTDSGTVDVIEFPNNPAATCGYKKNYLDLNTQGGYFNKFINDRTLPGPNPDNPGLTIKTQGICTGDSTYFSILPPLLPDSVQWDFGDSASGNNNSVVINPVHLYPATGKYLVTVTWYKCNAKVKQTLTVDIQDFTTINLGSDTSYCYKDSITLSTGISGANHTWNTGSTNSSIAVKKPGMYWVKVESGNCKTTDTINIKEIPPILIELGGDYAICDDDNELVKLDAGKGHSHYKWTPTGDTTQWIIVDKTGNYYVIVEDFRGCKGDDGTRVNRLCDFDFHIPNVFTPNGDGLNDVFAPVFSDIYNFNIEIYNRWGEQVFVSDNPANGWDGTYKGKPCADDGYTWKISFKGNHNKQLRNYNYKGVVTLLR